MTTDKTSTEVDTLAKKIWDYHLMHHELVHADCIFVLCSNDPRVAERAAEVYREGWAPRILFTGGFGRLTEGEFTRPEAEVFAEVARAQGVPAEAILIENKATNSEENIKSGRALLAERGIHPKNLILVQKPYMERRTFATFKNFWPEMPFVVTSPQISYEDYPNEQITKDLLINTIVGDLQRIKEYPLRERRFQIPQDIPDDVWEAYEALVAMGYSKQLIV